MTMDDLVRPEDAGGIGKGLLEGLAEAIPRALAEVGAHPIERSILDYLTFIFRVKFKFTTALGLVCDMKIFLIRLLHLPT